MADRKSLGIIGHIERSDCRRYRNRYLRRPTEHNWLRPGGPVFGTVEAVTGVAFRSLLVGSPAHAVTRLQNGGAEWTGH